jgi:hypothetical protein
MNMASPKASKSQAQKFREAARAVGADHSESAFNAALKKVAKAPPRKESKPKARKPAK